MIRNICVYAASSEALQPEYADATRRLGQLISERGYELVYGGGSIGLMGVIARAVHESGGHVIGVIPERLRGLELAYEAADELIVTRDLRDRKAIMEDRADAFIALPGGFGTLEEIIEVMVLKQLWYHEKPLVFLNVRCVYDKLIAFFDHLVTEQFIPASHQSLYHVCNTPEEAITYLDTYETTTPEQKWMP